MAKDIKVALAGVRRASSFFNSISSHPETEIVALCDIDEAALGNAASTARVSQIYPVFEKMLEDAKPDAVVIATPMHLHASQAILALQRDIHVLSEVTAAVSLEHL